MMKMKILPLQQKLASTIVEVPLALAGIRGAGMAGSQALWRSIFPVDTMGGQAPCQASFRPLSLGLKLGMTMNSIPNNTLIMKI